MTRRAKGWAAVIAGLALMAALVTCAVRDSGAGRSASDGPRRAAIADALGPKRTQAHKSRQATDADAVHAPSVATSSELLEGWSRAQREAIRRLVRDLAARGDVESLLDAALLLPLVCDGHDDCGAEQAERARLLAAAARVAPAHPLIAFLQAENCMWTGDCAAAYRRLAAIDPDNLFAHLGLLHAAATTGDPAALDRALRDAAAVPLYDTYHAELTAELDRALRRLPTPSAAVRAQLALAMGLRGALDEDGARLVQALGVSMAMGIPPLQTLVQTCHVDSVQQVPARRAPCLALLARMAASDTTLARSVGLIRLIALTAGTAGGAHWRERLREFAWVQERFFALQSAMNVEDLRRQLELGEWEMMRAMLRRHGVPLLPPSGWLPAQARYRQLLSGRG